MQRHVTSISIPISWGVMSASPDYRWQQLCFTLRSLEKNSTYQHDVLVVSESLRSPIIPQTGLSLKGSLKKQFPWVRTVDAAALGAKVLAKTDLSQPRVPVYECMNLGAKHLRTPWLITLVGYDTYFPPDWDSELLSHVDPRLRKDHIWHPRFLSTRYAPYPRTPAQLLYMDYEGKKDGEPGVSQGEFFYYSPTPTVPESELIRVGRLMHRPFLAQEATTERRYVSWVFGVMHESIFWGVGGFRENIESGADVHFDDDVVRNGATKICVMSTFICNSHCLVDLDTKVSRRAVTIRPPLSLYQCALGIFQGARSYLTYRLGCSMGQPGCYCTEIRLNPAWLPKFVPYRLKCVDTTNANQPKPVFERSLGSDAINLRKQRKKMKIPLIALESSTMLPYQVLVDLEMGRRTFQSAKHWDGLRKHYYQGAKAFQSTDIALYAND